MRLHIVLSAVMASCLSISCGATLDGDDDTGGLNETGNSTGGDTDGSIPIDGAGTGPDLVNDTEGCENIDLLFVIDNSGSMGEEQGNLATNFPQFAEVIDGFKTSSGDLIDYRVGVTTTGVTKRIKEEIAFGIKIDKNQRGADGKLVNAQCTESTRPWLERGDSDMVDKFSCMANVGTRGPSKEMPLEALRLSVSDRVADGSTADFYREDALLGVIFLTDENDCSRRESSIRVGFRDSVCDEVHPVIDYVSELDAFKGERGRWATAVIAGLESCSSDLGEAAKATRLLEFATLTGDNAVTSSICEGNLSTALEDALETFGAACRRFPEAE